MRTSFLFLAILVVCCYAQNTTSNSSDDYVPIPLSDLETNPLILDFLNYGLDNVIAKAVAKGDIPENVFDVTRIYTASKRVLRTRTYYRYAVKVTDHKNATLNSTFTVDVRNDSVPIAVTSYKYNAVRPGISLADSASLIGYTLIDPANHTDVLLQDLVSFGRDNIVQKGREAGKIPADEYSVAQIYNIYYKLNENSTRYRFDVDIRNKLGNIDVLANFTVGYDDLTGNRTFLAYNYRVQKFLNFNNATNQSTNVSSSANDTNVTETEPAANQTNATQNDATSTDGPQGTDVPVNEAPPTAEEPVNAPNAESQPAANEPILIATNPENQPILIAEPVVPANSASSEETPAN